MTTYNKPYLTYQKQLDLLKSRGLEVTNDVVALEYLRRLGYYRLSGYWYISRKLIPAQVGQPINLKRIRPRREDVFISGAKFQNAVELYVFDKKLRLLVLDAIERIEVAVRVDVAYLLGKKDSFAYNNPSLLHGNFTKKINYKTRTTKHQDWLRKHNQLIERSKEDFVDHYKEKYGLPLPIWVAIELWDFGLLSVFYSGMTVADKSEIALKYKISDWQVMESWLRCLNYVRNVVAHHNRLWNRNLIDQPKLAVKGTMPLFDAYINQINITSRIYIILCILGHFMQCICPRSSWRKKLVSLMESFPLIKDGASIQDMGFPADWKEHNFWKN